MHFNKPNSPTLRLFIFILFLFLCSNLNAQNEVEWDKTEHDFGTIQQDLPVRTNFKVKNIGDTDIIIGDLLRTCGCVMVSYIGDTIQPNETKSFTVKYKKATGLGQINKIVTFRSTTKNGPLQDTRLKISGLVLDELPCESPDIRVSPVTGTGKMQLDALTEYAEDDVLLKWYKGDDCSGSILGTNSSITVDQTGYYSVKAYYDGSENDCYDCSFGYASMEAACEIPAKPDTILGNTTAIVNSIETYKIAPIQNAEIYEFNVTGGTKNENDTSVTVTWRKPGKQVITVEAINSCGKSQSQSLEVLVTANSSPTLVNPISNMELTEGFNEIEIEISEVFDDPDQDKLTYTATSSNESVVLVNISNDVLTIAETGLGESEITLTANDGNGGVVSDTFSIEVKEEENAIPEVSNPISRMILTEGFSNIEIDLDTVFTDDDGDVLSYTASSSNENVISVSINQSILSITEESIGNSDLSLTANDNNGGQMDHEFEVEIKSSGTQITSINDKDDRNISVFPNPAKDVIEIKFNTTKNSENLTVEINDLMGKKYIPNIISKKEYKLDVSNFHSGLYLIKVSCEDQVFTTKVLIY